jgi:hypothetical protein
MENLKDCLLKVASTNALYWSYGSHPDWKFDCRVWKYVKNKNGKRRIPTVIGQGASLEDAIKDCLEKFERYKAEWINKGYIDKPKV